MTDTFVTVTSNITIPSLSTPSVNIPINITLDLTTLATQVAAILAPPVSTPPPPTTNPALVYFNGTFYWPGDYSWGVQVSYNDTNGLPTTGSHDISVKGNGGWQPYAPNFDFDPSPYTHLIFSVKPTLANDIDWGTGVMAKGDIAVGTTISDISQFAQGPIGPNIWTTYKIPLGSGGLNIPSGTHIYKFWIQDRSSEGSGTANNLWYVDQAYFQ